MTLEFQCNETLPLMRWRVFLVVPNRTSRTGQTGRVKLEGLPWPINPTFPHGRNAKRSCRGEGWVEGSGIICYPEGVALPCVMVDMQPLRGS